MNVAVTKLQLQSVKLTSIQFSLILHSLGLNRGEVEYRNYFFADINHFDYPDLEMLVAKGYMVRHESKVSPDLTYVVTKAGKEALKKLGLEWEKEK